MAHHSSSDWVHSCSTVMSRPEPGFDWSQFTEHSCPASASTVPVGST